VCPCPHAPGVQGARGALTCACAPGAGHEGACPGGRWLRRGRPGHYQVTGPARPRRCSPAHAPCCKLRGPDARACTALPAMAPIHLNRARRCCGHGRWVGAADFAQCREHWRRALPGVVPACWRAREAARARDFCYDFAPGERIGIVGRNGTGKVPHGRRAAAARIGRLRTCRPAQCTFASTCTIVCELSNKEQPRSEPECAASHGCFPVNPGSMHLEVGTVCRSLQYGCNAEVLWSLCQWEGSRAWLQI